MSTQPSRFQSPNTVLMVRPISFRSNEQTALDNFYQKQSDNTPTVNEQAQCEFDLMVTNLREVGIGVVVVDDTAETDTPDSIFPNNWVSFDSSGTVSTYPMYAENRRLERREDIMGILQKSGFIITARRDYSEHELKQEFLEGTGSMILDHLNAKCYLALSQRATPSLVQKWCDDNGYTPVVFNAYQSVPGKEQRLHIYHTNVMMSISQTFAVVCLDAIDNTTERQMVEKSLRDDGKEIIPISEDQVNHFAGNMLQVRGTDDIAYLVMSSQAYASLTPDQIQKIEAHCPILHTPLQTIETCGGGSARCMMAEVFLPRD